LSPDGVTFSDDLSQWRTDLGVTGGAALSVMVPENP
jgi:hypothetical protein